MSRRSCWLLFGVAPLAMLAVISIGCGNECGSGTVSENGQCVPGSEPGDDMGPGTGPDACGAGTMLVGTTCQLIPTDGPPPVDAPDMPAPDAGCTLMASSCGAGTHFNAANCSCDPDFVPPELVVEMVQEKVVENVLSGSIVKDGAGIFLYWTRGAAPYSVRKQQIDPATLTLMGMPADVPELGNNAFGPSASADGLWLAFGCISTDHGGMANTAVDLCISNRADVNAAWGTPRLMTEMTFSPGPMAAPVSLSSPSFRSDATGAPVEIFFSAYRHTAEGAGISICSNTIDGTGNATPYKENNILCPQGMPCDNSAMCPMGQTCNTDQPIMGMAGTCSACVETVCRRYQNTGPMIVSDLANSNAGPAWSADGQFFGWTKSGSGSAGAEMYSAFPGGSDIWIGRSSGMNGVVDSFVGGLTVNDGETQHSISFAPDASGIISWGHLVNPNNPADGSWISLGKISSFTPP
jgi:hypothetical protein